MTKNNFTTSLALIGLAMGVSFAQEQNSAAVTAQDSIQRVDVKNKVTGPIGFSGSMTFRVNNGQFFTEPEFAAPYLDRVLPYGGLNLKMVANPSPMIKLSTVMSVGSNFNGLYRSDYATKSQVTASGVANWKTEADAAYYSGGQRALYVHNNEREVTSIAEELIAAADIRTAPVKVEVQAGSALWVDQSPFTIYRRDNRHRAAWYYEAYEPEQSASTMYSYKLFNRIDWGGQPVWPRKTFGGVLTDFYELPAGFNAKFMIAEPSNARPLEKRGNSMSDWGDREALTSVSYPGWLYSARIANSQIPGLYAVNAAKGENRKTILGFNYLGIDFNDDIIYEEMPSNFGAKSLGNSFRNARFGSSNFKARAYSEKPYYAEPKLYSIDLKGNWSAKNYIHTELAMSKSDTNFFIPIYGNGQVATYDINNNLVVAPNDTALVEALPVSVKEQAYLNETKSGAPDYAAYFKMYNEEHILPFMVEAAYIGQKFYSPYGMTEYAVPIPVDEMVAGSGTLQYRQNQMGFNVQLMPRRLNGYLRFMFGEYLQVKGTQDIIRFQHNLTGRDLWKSSFSWSRFDPTMPFDQGHANWTSDRANLRVGDLNDATRPNGFSQQVQGGYIGDDSQLWERFAIYDPTTIAKAKAETNAAVSVDSLKSAVDETYASITRSKKASSTLSVDWGMYLSPALQLKNPLFVNFYAEANAIDKGIAMPFIKDAMFRDMLGMTEIVYGLTPTVHLVGMAGVELIQSKNTLRNGILGNGVQQAEDYLQLNINKNGEYNNVDLGLQPELYYSPIDYQQLAIGAGFDWDFSSRAGLHVRYKLLKHTDKAVDAINKKMDQWYAATSDADRRMEILRWQSPTSYSMGHFFAETKVWF